MVLGLFITTFTIVLLFLLKFLFSEKTTNFSYVKEWLHEFKSTVELLQNFVVFSEYMNFNINLKAPDPRKTQSPYKRVAICSWLDLCCFMVSGVFISFKKSSKCIFAIIKYVKPIVYYLGYQKIPKYDKNYYRLCYHFCIGIQKKWAMAA